METEFEKWLKEYGSDNYYRIGDMQAAFTAGQAAERTEIISGISELKVFPMRHRATTDNVKAIICDAIRARQ